MEFKYIVLFVLNARHRPPEADSIRLAFNMSHIGLCEKMTEDHSTDGGHHHHKAHKCHRLLSPHNTANDQHVGKAQSWPGQQQCQGGSLVWPTRKRRRIGGEPGSNSFP